jgi:hypothetical protein
MNDIFNYKVSVGHQWLKPIILATQGGRNQEDCSSKQKTTIEFLLTKKNSTPTGTHWLPPLEFEDGSGINPAENLSEYRWKQILFKFFCKSSLAFTVSV